MAGKYGHQVPAFSVGVGTAASDPGATTAPVADEEVAQSLFKFIDVLEDNDDVQTVYANFDIPEDLMAKLGG